MSIYRKIAKRLPVERFLPLMNLYPPYVGAGIRVRGLPGTPFAVESTMKLGLANQNFMGTHFGGSLYAMCDPFFAFILIQALGDGFTVWDKAASIRFRRPGVGKVSAEFRIDAERIDAIREEARRTGKSEPVLETVVIGEGGEVVAEVEKVVWVKWGERRKA